MEVDPQWIIAICAAVGLLITWTTTVIGGAFWFAARFDKLKREILKDFQAKHDDNGRKMAAIETLVIRHDIILDPEFNGVSRLKR